MQQTLIKLTLTTNHSPLQQKPFFFLMKLKKRKKKLRAATTNGRVNYGTGSVPRIFTPSRFVCDIWGISTHMPR